MRGVATIQSVVDHLAAAHNDLDPTVRAENIEKRKQYENNKVVQKCQRIHDIIHPNCTEECANMQLPNDFDA